MTGQAIFAVLGAVLLILGGALASDTRAPYRSPLTRRALGSQPARDVSRNLRVGGRCAPARPGGRLVDDPDELPRLGIRLSCATGGASRRHSGR